MVNGYAVHCNDIFYYLSIYPVVRRVCAWFRVLEVSLFVCGSPALWFVDGAVQNYGKRSHCLWALLPCVVKPGVCMVSRKWDLFHGCSSGGYQNRKSCVLGKPDRCFFSSCAARKVCDDCIFLFWGSFQLWQPVVEPVILLGTTCNLIQQTIPPRWEIPLPLLKLSLFFLYIKSPACQASLALKVSRSQ